MVIGVSTPGRSVWHGSSLAVALAIISLFQLLPTAAAQESETITAVWKTQQLRFAYQGYVSYSCDGLRKRLEKILRSVGAREMIVVRSSDCVDHFGAPTFQIVLQSPVVATPETVQELTAYNSTYALVARVRGESLPSEQDLPRFAAV